MQLLFEMTEDILIAALEGEVDHHTASLIREDIDKTIDVFHSKHLIFNLQKVTFMDSSGIGIIMGRYNKLEKLGGRIFVTGCNDYIDRILSMAGIFTIAGKADTAAAAIVRLSAETKEKEVAGIDERKK